MPLQQGTQLTLFTPNFRLFAQNKFPGPNPLWPFWWVKYSEPPGGKLNNIWPFFYRLCVEYPPAKPDNSPGQVMDRKYNPRPEPVEMPYHPYQLSDRFLPRNSFVGVNPVSSLWPAFFRLKMPIPPFLGPGDLGETQSLGKPSPPKLVFSSGWKIPLPPFWEK